MRGFNIGDRLTTKDGKHSGIVTKIETVIENVQIRNAKET